MNNLFTKHVPVTRDTTRSLIAHMPLKGKANPQFVTLTIPPFTVPQFSWPNKSIIVTEFRYTSTEPFSILKPFNPGSGFCLAIRWGNVNRYKLWSGVGETLNYPLYNCELIPAGQFVIEVWTVSTSTTVTSLSNIVLLTSMIGSFRGTNDASLVCSCGDNVAGNITLTEVCGIFQGNFKDDTLPWTFDTCLSTIATWPAPVESEPFFVEGYDPTGDGWNLYSIGYGWGWGYIGATDDPNDLITASRVAANLADTYAAWDLSIEKAAATEIGTAHWYYMNPIAGSTWWQGEAKYLPPGSGGAGLDVFLPTGAYCTTIVIPYKS